MEQGRDMTIEDAIQELFKRTLTLEAKCMAQENLISVLIAIVACMPSGVGIDETNSIIERSRSEIGKLPFQDPIGGKKIADVMNEVYGRMILTSHEANKKVKFESIDGGRDN